MAQRVSDEQNVTVRFGGGLHTRAYEQDIDELEAASGENFELDPLNTTLRPRKPFDLIGKAPNSEPILGMGSLLRTDGSTDFFFQAGDRVYEWNPGKAGEEECYLDLTYSPELADLYGITEYETVEADARPQRVATSSSSERYSTAPRVGKRSASEITETDRLCVEVDIQDGDGLTAGFIGLKELGSPSLDGVEVAYNEFTTGDVLGFVVTSEGKTEAYKNGTLLRKGDTISDFYLTINTTGAPLDVLILAEAHEMKHFDSYNAQDFCVNGPSTYTLGFTEIAKVDRQARLRGRLEHNWQLSDKVIVTDIEMVESVHEWDGTTGGFKKVEFRDASGNLFDSIKAKYCVIAHERAFFANIMDNERKLPQLIVGSERGDYTVVSAGDRPSSAIGASDPFFLVHPENRPVNGVVKALNIIAISGREGSFYKLTGSSSNDFDMDSLFPGSAATGEEAVEFVGNDVAYGRAGAVSTISRASEFGDAEEVDISIPIAPSISKYREWRIVYNSRTNRVYCFPEGGRELWVLQKQMVGGDVSPWMRFTTTHSLSFDPLTVMSCLDPTDGLEYVFMGDSDGNLYRLEGKVMGQDAGSDDIVSRRRSKLFSPPIDMRTVGGMECWVTFKKKVEDVDVNLSLLFAGESINDVKKSLKLTGLSGGAYYGGSAHYGGSEYYGILLFDRSARRRFQASGGSTEFQVEVEVTGARDFEIAEVGLRFRTQA